LRKPATTPSPSDPFFRIGDLSKIADVKEVVGKANTLADTQMLADLDALVAFVENQPKANTRKLGITGMCRGGRTVWMYTAHSNKIKAGVSWYGGLNPNPPAQPLTPIDIADKLNAPCWGSTAAPTRASRSMRSSACAPRWSRSARKTSR